MSGELEIARALIRAGVPVFAAPPAVRDGEWDPSGGTDGCGYWLPKEWQKTVTAEEWLDPAAGPVWREKAWRPGWALGAVMGHAVDGLDVDPPNGGADSIAALRAAGMIPRTTGLQRTPSGGWHALIAPLGVGSENAVRPGLDIKGGKPDGSSRGFLFIAPTVKLSKTTGRPEQYAWESAPDPEELDGDTSGEALAALIAAPRARQSGTPTADEFLGADRHTGPIAAGKRHEALLSYAGRLRDRRLTLAEAEVLYEQRWRDCEQPPNDPEPWEKALDRLRDVFTRYPPGQAEQHARAGQSPAESAGHRRLRVTRASEIQIRPVRWLWKDRVALGTLCLHAGREGVGKSVVEADLVSQITRGVLPGESCGYPRSVVVCATEDSWEHTIVPRLMAAHADLTRVIRVDVTTATGTEGYLTLPADLPELERIVRDEDVALIVLDPLMSRLDAKLDSHKDQEVRQALEPLVAMADRTRAAIIGLIHVNKSISTDPLNLVMGSRAFSAVARAVLFAMRSPDDETTRYLGQPKNNLGRTDLPTLTYRIEQTHVADTDEGPVFTARVEWIGDTDKSIQDLLVDSGEDAESRSASGEAAAWMRDYLTGAGGIAPSSEVKDEGKKAGHTAAAVRRAREKLKLTVEARGYPCVTYWSLPDHQWSPTDLLCPVVSAPGETDPTSTTRTTSQNGQGDLSSGAGGASRAVPARGDTTGHSPLWHAQHPEGAVPGAGRG